MRRVPESIGCVEDEFKVLRRLLHGLHVVGGRLLVASDLTQELSCGQATIKRQLQQADDAIFNTQCEQQVAGL